MDIVIDFDGTVVTNEFPDIGKEIGATDVLKELVKNGHNLILSTMRSDIDEPIVGDNKEIIEKGGLYLTEAVRWFKERNIPLYGIQKHPTQHNWTYSPKAYGQMIIDDSALGCPLKYDLSISTKPFVDWEKIKDILQNEYGLI